jgi:TatD DNase family protein
VSPLSDTHCHLYLNSFDADRPAVLERAWQRGLDRILLPGINLDTSHQAVALSEQHPGLYAAVGVHPNDAMVWDNSSLEGLRELAHHPKVVAIGEIGLDYYRHYATPDLQQHILRQQLALASEICKPVVLHNRAAQHDLIPILQEWHEQLVKTGNPLKERPGVFHSFDGSFDPVSLIKDCGFFIGISGPLTFEKNTAFQKTMAQLPLSALLLETDAPYLTPHPYRGRRNEPAHVELIAKKIASLTGLLYEEIVAATSSNANRLFGWSIV